jgi:hypothetical protein
MANKTNFEKAYEKAMKGYNIDYYDFSLAFREGAKWVIDQLKHSDWTHLDPPEPCGCITCIKLRAMGL